MRWLLVGAFCCCLRFLLLSSAWTTTTTWRDLTCHHRTAYASTFFLVYWKIKNKQIVDLRTRGDTIITIRITILIKVYNNNKSVTCNVRTCDGRCCRRFQETTRRRRTLNKQNKPPAAAAAAGFSFVATVHALYYTTTWKLKKLN